MLTTSPQQAYANMIEGLIRGASIVGARGRQMMYIGIANLNAGTVATRTTALGPGGGPCGADDACTTSAIGLDAVYEEGLLSMFAQSGG